MMKSKEKTHIKPQTEKYVDAQVRGQNDEQVSADEERLTEEIIADWRQMKRESPQIREGRGEERTLRSSNYSEEEQQERRTQKQLRWLI